MREQMGVVSLQSFKEQWRKRISQSYILSFKSVTHLIPLFVKSILFCIVRRFGLPGLPLDVVCRFENPTCSAFDHPKQGAFHQTASYDRHLALPFLCHRSLCSRPLIQVVETWGGSADFTGAGALQRMKKIPLLSCICFTQQFPVYTH